MVLPILANPSSLGTMACIPLAYPPIPPVPRSEPAGTPHPFNAPPANLPNLGQYTTSYPGTSRVRKTLNSRKPQYRPIGAISHLSPEEQIVELRQSRKAIRSKLYSKIARLQLC